MFKRLLKKIIDFPYEHSTRKWENKLRHNEMIWKQREIISIQYLLNLLGEESYPGNSNMALSPVTICHILNEIVINKRKFIIEFGAGNSTVYIAKLLQKTGINAKYYSIDSDKEWIEVVKERLLAHDISGKVELVCAPIKETTQFQSSLSLSFKWYDTEILNKKINGDRFDLIIVDGPVGFLCPFSRFPAAQFLKNNLSDSYTIFLDDISRTDEEKILDEWSYMLNEKISFKYGRYGWISKNTRFHSNPA